MFGLCFYFILLKVKNVHSFISSFKYLTLQFISNVKLYVYNTRCPIYFLNLLQKLVNLFLTVTKMQKLILLSKRNLKLNSLFTEKYQ